MNNHKDLKVWQRSMELVTEIYTATREFPKEELFGLTSQLRRAAVSIPSNIAEGYGRLFEKETIRFLSIALGSTAEVETQLYIAKDLGFISLEKAESIISSVREIARMLPALIKSIKQPVNSQLQYK